MSAPSPDTSTFWMWLGGGLISAITVLFGILLGLINGRVNEAKEEARHNLEMTKADVENDIRTVMAAIDTRFSSLSTDIVGMRDVVADAQRQHLDMLKSLQELPKRDEMQHGFEVLEARLTDRIVSQNNHRRNTQS